jgi:predicted  nucleic acid-binding Zn-ribbon protein
MVKECEYCGETFEYYDNREKKYCSKCRKNGKRFYNQFKEKRKDDPVTDTYTKHYAKRWGLWKKHQLSKTDLDDWRKQAAIKRTEIKAGKISIADFVQWCESTEKCIDADIEIDDGNGTQEAVKTTTVLMEESIYNQIKIRSAENKMTLREYILHLITNDLNGKNKPVKGILSERHISQKSVEETQKILDFVRDIMTENA